jgi:hypothetical protein
MRIISLSALFLAGSSAAAQAPATWVYCYGAAANTPQYYSTPFDVGSEGLGDGRSSFIKHLEQKYGMKGLVRCTSPRTLEVAQAELKKVAADIQRGMNLKIETDWVYTKAAATPPAPPVAAPPPAPPAPPPAAAPAKPAPPRPAPSPAPSPAAPPPAPVVKQTHAVCWADFRPGPRYYSAVFDGTKGDYADWMPAFKEFLGTQYKYGGQVRCTKKPSKAEAQKYWDDMVGAARALPPVGGVKVKIVETGWKY